MKKKVEFRFLGERLKGEMFTDTDGRKKVKDEKGLIYYVGTKLGQAKITKNL